MFAIDRLRWVRSAPALAAMACAAFAMSRAQAQAAVTIAETADLYTLDNGIVTASVAKASGDLVSMKYKGMEMLATVMTPDGQPDLQKDPPGENRNTFGMTDHQYGFWSHDSMGQKASNQPAIDTITIDPKSNGGERAEVSVKGISNNKKMGTGPGAAQTGDFPADIELRYALGRGDSGVFTYCVFDHKPEYDAATMTEARFCFKLNDVFDWMLVDEHHNKLYPKEARENKYDYTTVQSKHPAYGWASTTKNIGCFLVNPSVEYLSGGPTKVEFLCHRDTNAVAAPCILNYWRSSHYGGATVSVAKGEEWVKVIGPFMLYCNSGADPQVMWKDAIDQAAKQSAAWPFDWVKGIDYPGGAERGAVSGKLVLNDKIMPEAKMTNIQVGLAHPEYEISMGGPNSQGFKRTIDWQTDARNYEFWVHAADDGSFTIPKVRPGVYTLHAFADGVLGEFAKADVEVAAGKTLDLGNLDWTPVRHGKQIWDLGIPNRTSSEFLKGDDYYHDGMQVMYASLFPNDVNYVVGKSDFRKDVYYQQVPHATAESIAAAAAAAAARRGAPARLPGEGASIAGAPRGAAPVPPTAAGSPAPRSGAAATSGTATRAGGARGARRGGGGPPPITGAATPWKITFNMPEGATTGKAILRAAISGTSARTVDVQVNDKPAGQLQLASNDATFGMGNGIQGLWYERELPFDASMLKPGENTMTLTVPAGVVTAGVMYDYLRLEMDDSAK